MTNKFGEIKDSGERQEFQTGAVRDSNAKTRYDLISPLALRRLADHLAAGAVKYSEWNWTLGMPNSRYYASLLRHLFAYANGDRSEDHAAACCFNIMGILHNEEAIDLKLLPAELNDMPLPYIRGKECSQ